MAIQSDGKILLACYMGSGSAVDEVVMRLTSSGAIDTTYGGGTGQRVIDFGGLDLPLRMVLDSSGRAVVAGSTDSGDATLFRLTTSGDLDTTFSTDGKMLVDFGGSGDGATGVAIDSAGGIIIGGHGGANDDLIVARILSGGTLDTSFGTNGVSYASFGPGADEGEDLAIDSTGKIIVGGSADGKLAFAVARFNADGTPDMTFGTNGKVRIDFATDATVENSEAMTVQSDDKIVIAGRIGGDFGVARLNAVTTTTKTRLYVQQDANYNVTSITDDMGGVLERYITDSYGKVTVLNPDWTVRTGGTNFDQRYLYQGERFDPEAGLYHMTWRDYDPSLGRFIQQDPNPAGQYNDGMNLYQMEGSGPITALDPTGLDAGIQSYGMSPNRGPAANQGWSGYVRGKGYPVEGDYSTFNYTPYPNGYTGSGGTVPSGWAVSHWPNGWYANPPLGGGGPGPGYDPHSQTFGQAVRTQTKCLSDCMAYALLGIGGGAAIGGFAPFTPFPKSFLKGLVDPEVYNVWHNFTGGRGTLHGLLTSKKFVQAGGDLEAIADELAARRAFPFSGTGARVGGAAAFALASLICSAVCWNGCDNPTS